MSLLDILPWINIPRYWVGDVISKYGVAGINEQISGYDRKAECSYDKINLTK